MNETELTGFLTRALKLIRVQQQNIDNLWRVTTEAGFHLTPEQLAFVRSRNSQLLDQVDAMLVAMEHGDVGAGLVD